jgi:hypothetical protein
MKPCSQDVTGAVVSLGGGALFVCGECLVNAGDGISTLPPYDAASVEEALCTRIVAGQDLDRQLAREITAASLNCIISGFGPHCVGSSIEDLFEDCNASCDKNPATAATRTTARCIKEFNCFNTGYETDAAGRCVGTTHCATRVFPLDVIFPTGTLCTVNQGQRKLGPPGSDDECSMANNTTCSIVPPNESQCRLRGVLIDSCP